MAHLDSSPYVLVGAGMHGLSTAYHLALELERRGSGSGADILVVDKATAKKLKLGKKTTVIGKLTRSVDGSATFKVELTARAARRSRRRSR